MTEQQMVMILLFKFANEKLTKMTNERLTDKLCDCVIEILKNNDIANKKK